MQKITLYVPRTCDFRLVTADFYMNWLVPYFRNHAFVYELVFNRCKVSRIVTIEFEVCQSLAFVRFLSDLENFITSSNIFLLEASFHDKNF